MIECLNNLKQYLILIILRHDNKKPFPFGPFLISGAITYILAGNTLIELYLRLYNIY